MDLMTASLFNEHFTSDRTDFPAVYQMGSGLSVFLPPEGFVISNGMSGYAGGSDLLTVLRSAFAIGNTAMVFEGVNGIMPDTLEAMDPQFKKTFLRYTKLYREFFRPMIATTKVYHHAPVNARGGVESGHWFAMEFTAPDKTKGWATIARFSGEPETYLFKPKGLAEEKTYQVTFDNSGQSKVIKGSELMQAGLHVQTNEHPRSELILFEAR